MGSYNNTVNDLMGNLSNDQESNSSPLSDIAYQTLAFYADDQVKVNKRLSVQVGFRFEHIGWWRDDRQGYRSRCVLSEPCSAGLLRWQVRSRFHWHAIDAAFRLSGRSDRLGFLSPRFGLSYDVFGNGKHPGPRRLGSISLPGICQYTSSCPCYGSGGQELQCVLLGVIKQTEQHHPGLSRSIKLAAFAPNCQVQCAQTGQSGYDPNDYYIPLTDSYNFTIYQRLPWHMQLDLAYVG